MSSAKTVRLQIADCFLAYSDRSVDDLGFSENLNNSSAFKTPTVNRLEKSKSNSIRGIHCSNFSKCVACLHGEIYAVVVDLRPVSPTFLKWQGFWVDTNSNESVSIKIDKNCGFAYYSKSDSVILHTEEKFQNAKEDLKINAFDTTINIEWPKSTASYSISEIDRLNPQFNEKLFSEYLQSSASKSIESHETSLKENVESQLNIKNIMITGGAGFIGKLMLITLKLKRPKIFKKKKSSLSKLF